MKTSSESETIVNHQQLIDALKIAVETSKRSLHSDGILLILWGLTLSINFLWKYVKASVLTVLWMRQSMNIVLFILLLLSIIATIYFLFLKPKKQKTYTAISTRYVWAAVIVAHNLIIMVTKTVLNEVNFQLLHPIQMVLIGFALFVTGEIYRYRLLSISGIVMWIAAIIASKYSLDQQFLIRAISDFICFVIPGIIMYTSLKKR